MWRLGEAGYTCGIGLMGRPARYTPEQVLEAYKQHGECIQATARHLGCAPMTVRNYLARTGWEPQPWEGQRGPEGQPTEVMRVEVGLSALVGAKVVFDEGFDYSIGVRGDGQTPGK